MSDPTHVFVSRPTRLGEQFEAAYADFHIFLSGQGFIGRRLGQGDYSIKAPLEAVIDIIDECCGAIVLGYPQIEFRHEVRRAAQLQNSTGYVFPTPWNQIEGALAYRARAPVIVVAHKGVSGGLFDHGVTGQAVLHADLSRTDWFKEPSFMQPFFQWKDMILKCGKPTAAIRP